MTPISVRFRAASPEDLSDIVSIEQAAHTSPWSLSQLQESLLGGHLFWVAVDEEKIIAYVVIMRAAQQWELLNIAVNPEQQGGGIGRCCITHMLAQSRLHSVEEIFLEVRRSNEAAIQLYRNNGFAQVGRRKDYYENGKSREDALIMCKVL